MKRFWLALMAALVVALGAPGLGRAQEGPPDMEAAMEVMQKYATPGEHHKHLEALVGSWDTRVKFWPAPGAPVQESSGKARHSAVLDGRFIHVTYDGEFMGQPFHGMGYVGYDNYKQKYIDVWIDSMGTMMMTSEGTCDGSGEVLTMRGRVDDPVQGQTVNVKSVYRFVSPDQYVLEMYSEIPPDGEEFKVMEIVHTRSPQLAAEELARAATHLEATRLGLLDATADLSEAQWHFKPGPDRWSAAEIVEHLALSEDFLFNLVAERVMKAPPLTEPRADAPQIDVLVLARIADRSQKQQAPAPVRPTGRFASPQKALEHFRASRARTLEYLKTTAGLRAHALPFPLLGKALDAYQWILFISAHTDRHTQQLREVKADPNFPKK